MPMRRAMKQSPFNSLLVPTDFSDASQEAFQWAMRCIDGSEAVVIVLHVLDQALIETIATHEFAERDEVAQRMRKHAEDHFEVYRGQASGDTEVDTIIAEGSPFVEIIRKADDFAVDAIVMAKVGRGRFEKLLFGTTAEKVIRGASQPVIVLPPTNAS